MNPAPFVLSMQLINLSYLKTEQDLDDNLIIQEVVNLSLAMAGILPTMITETNSTFELHGITEPFYDPRMLGFDARGMSFYEIREKVYRNVLALYDDMLSAT